MKREMKIMGDIMDWVSPNVGNAVGRILNQDPKPVRMVLVGCAGVIYSSLKKKGITNLRASFQH